jgi:hypothetical protein
MAPDEALSLMNEWKITGAKLVASGKNADGSGISLAATRLKSTCNDKLTLLAGNQEFQFDLSAATYARVEGVPADLLKLLITSVSISFPNGARLALCEVAR